MRPRCCSCTASGAARLVWAPVLAPLAARYDVLAVDLPGHGASAPLPPGADAGCAALAAGLGEVLQALGVTRPHVVGNSLGGVGRPRARRGRRRRERDRAGPAGLRAAPGRAQPRAAPQPTLARLTGRLGEALAANALGRRLTFASGTADPAALDPGLARGVVHAMRTSTAYEAMIAATRHRTFDRGARVRVPVTSCSATTTGSSRPPTTSTARRRRPGARWVVLPRCGHAPMWDAPARTVELVDETVSAA